MQIFNYLNPVGNREKQDIPVIPCFLELLNIACYIFVLSRMRNHYTQ